MAGTSWFIVECTTLKVPEPPTMVTPLILAIKHTRFVVPKPLPVVVALFRSVVKCTKSKAPRQLALATLATHATHATYATNATLAALIELAIRRTEFRVFARLPIFFIHL